ncbi:MAG: Hsp33 family molecular chaperone HslO [bacterium]
MNDYLVKAYAFGGTVRLYGARTTDLVEMGRHTHDTLPAATAAFGRVLTAGAIMGAMYKGDQTLTIRIDGGGPIGGIVVTANPEGEVRGYVGNPHVHGSTNDGKLAVGFVVGHNGFVRVTKNLNMKTIFTSSAELQTGEIAEDFTYYFTVSEQIPSAVGLGVLIETDNSVLAAGGFILQVMPGASSDVLDRIESNIKAMRPVSELIRIGFTPEQIVSEITGGDHEIVETLKLGYSCDCTRDRFAAGIVALGKQEIAEMIAAATPIETVCHFCGKKHHFSVEDLQTMLTFAEKPTGS